MFNEIWDQHKSYLLNFIRSKVEDEKAVEDLLQEVSIKLYNNITRQTEIINYKKWLFQVTRNTIADFYRKNKKHSEIPIEQPQMLTASSTSCICDLSEFVIRKYLPEKYGKPLYLSDLEQKPQQEIAEILNLSLTATKSRIQRARLKLKDLVEDCLEISYNSKGQISDFHLKKGCELPQELQDEIKRLNLFL